MSKFYLNDSMSNDLNDEQGRITFFLCLLGITTVCVANFFHMVYVTFFVTSTINWEEFLVAGPIVILFGGVYWFTYGFGWLICFGYSALYILVLRKTRLNKYFIYKSIPVSHLILLLASIISFIFLAGLI